MSSTDMPPTRRPSAITDPEAVLAAMEEFDRLGREAFLSRYGFGASLSYFLFHGDNQYDAKAVLGAAFGHQFTSERALANNEFDGGSETQRALERLGFVVRQEATKVNLLELFARLKFARANDGSPYPHKALVVLDALARFRAGEPRLAPVADIRSRVSSQLAARLPEVASPSALEPIWRLESKVWEVIGPNGDVIQRVGDPLAGVLDQPGVTCGFTESVFEVLSSDPALVDQVEQTVRRVFGMPAARRWVFVHVGTASESNAAHSFAAAPNSLWGWKSSTEDLETVRPGDRIVFASDLKGGSPRCSPADFNQRSYGRIRFGEITSEVFDDDTPFWPDELAGNAAYPVRVRFDAQEEHSNLSMAEIDSILGFPGSGNFRWSATRNSAVVTSPPPGEITHMPASQPRPTSTTDDLAAVCSAIAGGLTDAGLTFGAGEEHDTFVRTVVTSLITKRFLILTGLSGSGKTQIAKQIGHWLGDGQHLIVPVRPDWTSPEAVLGYENALAPTLDGRPAWSTPLTLQFILLAADQPERPFILILDEMNLAHVERYFADILSGIESDEPVIPRLERTEDGVWRPVSNNTPLMQLPDNLFIVGTVNVDETTYMFSPKVLDRANTIEFRVSTASLNDGRKPGTISPGNPELVRTLLDAARDPAPTRDDRNVITERLSALHSLLIRWGREFGHRTHTDALRFADLLSAAGEPDPDVAIDQIVMQKILPRVHGSIRDVEGPLIDLGRFCAGHAQSDGPTYDPTTYDGPLTLPRSHTKIARMVTRLRANHFVTFTE